jgi:predicted metalloprotease with PDZ domain
MMKHLFLFTLPLMLCSVAHGAVAPTTDLTVHYSLAPDVVGGSLKAFNVEVRFKADPSGTTGFGWQEGWDGITKAGRFARHLTVDGATSLSQDHDDHWRIYATPGATLTVRYTIVGDNEPVTDLSKFDRSAPVIRSTWFSALGVMVFGLPDGVVNRPATFVWTGGSEFPLVSDLQHLSSPDHVGMRPGTTDDVLMSTLVGGPAVVVVDDQKRSGIRAAILPGSVDAAESFAVLVKKISIAERQFWNETRPVPFVITATPVPRIADSVYYSGAGFADSFAIWTNADTSPSALAQVVAHEYFHSWNASRLGAPYGTDGLEQREAWFIEGFTDYFASAIAVRSGALTPAQFRDYWNNVLFAYATSPVRNTPGDEAAKAFFTNYEAGHLPYQRGALLAALWNTRLHAIEAKPGEKGIDLRTILLAQFRAAKQTKTSPATLFTLVAKTYGLEVSGDLRRFNAKGETILLPTETFGPCAQIVTRQQPVFDPGFDRMATNAAGGAVKGVVLGSNAYLAGLRDGMKVLKRTSGVPGDSTVIYELSVMDGATTRLISFLPKGKGVLTVQSMKLIKPESSSCAVSLSGISSIR